MDTLSTVALAPVSSGASSTAVAPSIIPTAAPAPAPSSIAQVRYLSPVIEIDPEAGLALLKVRNVENGDVRFQLPPERVVREYKSAEATAAAASEARIEARAELRTAAAAPATTSSIKSDRADARQA